MSNYKLLEEKVYSVGVNNLEIKEAVELRDFYVSQLDYKSPSKNKDIFSKFLSLEKHILCEYSNIKTKLDNICETKNITKDSLCNIIKENNLNLSLFFENDILSLIQLVKVVENV